MRILELFSDDSNHLSMSRFAVFCCIPPAVWIVLHDYDKLDVFLGAFVINYGIGKVTDAMGHKYVATNSQNVLETDSAAIGNDINPVADKPMENRRKAIRSYKKRAF